MKTSALAFAMMIALGGASFAQSGGGSGGGSAGGGSAGGGSAGASTGGAAGTSSGAGAATGGPVGSVPGTSTSGPTMGAGVGSGMVNAPATGGVPTTPGGLDNQLQSNQNQQTGTAPGRSGAATAPSNLATSNPGISGSGRDAGTRAQNAAQCEGILGNRSAYPADQVAACEKSSANDPAGALDRRLQTENSRAVNSICRGC
ncbi:MAG: hypothetical protein JWO64_1742 [Hyphomicrobiales bacterium]|nr:hypothetical protein [Hyphomicrobiales bacterium]